MPSTSPSIGSVEITRFARLALMLFCLAGGCEERAQSPATPALDEASRPLVPPNGMSPFMSTPFIAPGFKGVVAEPADAAAVDDDAEVVGVSVQGRHRSYLLSALSTPATHVIDDVLDGVPVTVTFCDQTSCTRVFTGPTSDEPLEFGLGGWQDGQMLVSFRGRMFLQNSPDIPCDELSFEITTWKEWKNVHPDTDIFMGPQPTAK